MNFFNELACLLCKNAFEAGWECERLHHGKGKLETRSAKSGIKILLTIRLGLRISTGFSLCPICL